MDVLRKFAAGYPVLAVTGPRQSGKTTLVRATFPEKPYVSLEDPDQLESATSDPRGFLGLYPDGAVLDEAQRCPSLFSFLQTRVDLDGRSGLFVLTGSQQFGLLSKITQSLAGRVAIMDWASRKTLSWRLSNTLDPSFRAGRGILDTRISDELL